ncbi:MAG: hypothetical protein M3O99_06895 [Chloroflexota bacterium]|nr:hypothetical protein [Chloroflexota bacterium]
MTYALWRLLVICVAAAAGETIAYQLEWYDIVMWFGVFFGAAAYILTQDLNRPRPSGGRRGEIKYWRGRRIDDDDPPRRLN